MKTSNNPKQSSSVEKSRVVNLAVAAAAIGMTIGISTQSALAIPAPTGVQADALQTSFSADNSIQVATNNPVKQVKPKAAYPKIERPGAKFPKIERPRAAYPKIEIKI